MRGDAYCRRTGPALSHHHVRPSVAVSLRRVPGVDDQLGVLDHHGVVHCGVVGDDDDGVLGGEDVRAQIRRLICLSPILGVSTLRPTAPVERPQRLRGGRQASRPRPREPSL